jgi:hypothetical protein
MTLGGATRGDAVEAKGLAESRDGIAASASALRFMTDSSRAVSNPTDKQDNVLQTQDEEWRQKQSHRAGKTYPRPGHAAVRPWLGQTGQTRRPRPDPPQGSRPERSPRV